MNMFARALQTDLAAVEAKSQYVPPPPGSYQTTITNVEQKKYGTGSKGIRLTFKIIEGEFEGKDFKEDIVLEDPQGQANDFAAAKLQRRLMAAGFTPEYLRTSFKYPENEKKLGDFAKLIGKQVITEIEHQVGETGKLKGKTLVRVRKVEAPTTGGSAA